MPLKRGKRFPNWSLCRNPDSLSDEELFHIARHSVLPQERDAANSRLARSRDTIDAAVTRLLHACFDPDYHVRDFAITGLKQLVVPVHHWRNSNNTTKFWDQPLSFEMRNEIIEWMKQVDEYLQTVYISLQIRGALGDESIIDEAVPLLLNDDRWFKTMLVDALGELGSESSIAALRSLLDQNMDPRYRHSVYLNLVRLGCGDAVDWLVSKLNYGGLYLSESRTVKFALALCDCQNFAKTAKTIVTRTKFDEWSMDAATYFWDELKDLPYDEDIVRGRMLELLA